MMFSNFFHVEVVSILYSFLSLNTIPLEKSLILGKIEGKRRRRQQRMKWLDGITDLMDMSLSKCWDMVKDREAWHVSVHGVARTQT